MRLMPFMILGSVLLLGWGHVRGELFSQQEIRPFVELMQAKHGFDQAQLQDLLAQVQVEPRVLELISRPSETKPWHQYRSIFITQQRIQAGVEFWKQHRDVLQRAEKKYQVPAEIIVAILGVETAYGKNMGHFPVLTSLSTLAFRYPPRAAFFKQELEEFLVMMREEGQSASSIRSLSGSYAGAIGMPQFIPSSCRHYGIDARLKGKKDLMQDKEDIVFSVANYFRQHGWQKGLPIAIQVNHLESMQKLGIQLKWDHNKIARPHYTTKQLLSLGLNVPSLVTTPQKDSIKWVVVGLTGPHRTEYWLGTDNFYAITRYNRSVNYAMAVYQLAEKIKRSINHAFTEFTTLEQVQH